MTGLDIALTVLAAALLGGLARVVAGPSVADRAVGADVCFYVVVAGLSVLSAKLGSAVFLDLVLVGTLLGFVASVSLARLIRSERRDERSAGQREEGGTSPGEGFG